MVGDWRNCDGEYTGLASPGAGQSRPREAHLLQAQRRPLPLQSSSRPSNRRDEGCYTSNHRFTTLLVHEISYKIVVS
jgi:hypothetical protein